MTDRITRYADITPFTADGDYSVEVRWKTLEINLKSLGELNGVDLDPDFQRGHVWSDEQGTRYVEYCLRGGKAARTILFNKSGWNGRGKDHGEPVVLVDGKQRLEAVRKFLSGKIPAFGTFVHEFEDVMPSLDLRFTFTVNSLETRQEVLQWYLDLNSGGVVHSDEELARVRDLLVKEG